MQDCSAASPYDMRRCRQPPELSRPRRPRAAASITTPGAPTAAGARRCARCSARRTLVEADSDQGREAKRGAGGPREPGIEQRVRSWARWAAARSPGAGARSRHRRKTRRLCEIPPGARTARLRSVLRRRLDPARGAAPGPACLRLRPQPGGGDDQQGAGRVPAEVRGPAAGQPRGPGGKLANGGAWNAKGAQGLAEDVRYYGRWMRDEARSASGICTPRSSCRTARRRR